MASSSSCMLSFSCSHIDLIYIYTTYRHACSHAYMHESALVLPWWWMNMREREREVTLLSNAFKGKVIIAQVRHHCQAIAICFSGIILTTFWFWMRLWVTFKNWDFMVISLIINLKAVVYMPFWSHFRPSHLFLHWILSF